MSPARLQRIINILLLEMKLAELTGSFPQRFYINCTEEEVRENPFIERTYIL